MPVITDITIELAAEEVVRSLQRGRKVVPLMLERAEEAVGIAKELWRPAAALEWIEVGDIEGGKVTVRSPFQPETVVLNVGPHVDLLEKAEIALVSIHTIGPLLEEKARDLNGNGKPLLAYLLDSAGVVGLGKVGEAVREMAECEASERRWGVGANLSPGSLVGWDVREQSVLYALVPAREAGIAITAEHILKPFKSAVSVIGMGPEYRSKKAGSVCKFCLHHETCWRRREEA